MAEDEREFDYIKGSERGPEHWGELKLEWSTCKTGKLQSPIDLWNTRVKIISKSSEIIRMYKPTHAILKNRGHDIEVLSNLIFFFISTYINIVMKYLLLGHFY